MSTKRKAKHDRTERRIRNRLAARVTTDKVPPPPAERSEVTPEIKALFRRTDNVFDIPLELLRPHKCHGSRDPYANTVEGLTRRLALERHIRIAGGWQPTLCEILTVVKDRDGTLWVICGLGRVYMADRLSGGLVHTLPCRVLPMLSERAIQEVYVLTATQITKPTRHQIWESETWSKSVRDIKAIRESFGHNWPKLRHSTVMFGYQLGNLAQSVAHLNNTSLGVMAKRVTTMANAVMALGSLPKFDGARFRYSVDLQAGGPNNEYFSAWVFDKAIRRANAAGYTYPHSRTVSWFAAIILGEFYNAALPASRRLDLSLLDNIVATGDAKDAFSASPPKPLRQWCKR